MTVWITLERFREVLISNGFTIAEDGAALVVTRPADGFIWPYEPRPDGRVPPKVYTRIAYKFGIDIAEFVEPPFVR